MSDSGAAGDFPGGSGRDDDGAAVVDVHAVADLPRTVPAHPSFTLDGRATRPRPEVDLYKERGLDLTPVERVARRRNRRWMLGFVVPSLVILVLALIAAAIAESNEPSGPKQTVPAGYKLQNDGYFSYLIPNDWSNNPLFTDSDGDLENSGSGGFAGENIAYRANAPVLGEAQPKSLAAFGMARPEPYQLSAGHAIDVRGASTSFEYTVTRAGGFHAVAVDAWDAKWGVELWLLVDAPDAVTSRLLGSLAA